MGLSTLIGLTVELKWENFWEDRVNCCYGIDVQIGSDIYSLTNVYNRNKVDKLTNNITNRMEISETK